MWFPEISTANATIEGLEVKIAYVIPWVPVVHFFKRSRSQSGQAAQARSEAARKITLAPRVRM